MTFPWRWLCEDSQRLPGIWCQVLWWSVCFAGRAVCCPGSGPTDAACPTGDGRGSLFAPSAWVVLSAPVQKQIGLKLYGFYIGELETPVAQVDVPIRATKFLTMTPSYMGYSVPASGLNKLPPQPGGFTDSYEEHQFRIDGTVAFAVRKFEISAATCMSDGFVPLPRTT